MSWFMIKERLADDKFREIYVCVSPTQAKKYAIKPMVLKTYQPDALGHQQVPSESDVRPDAISFRVGLWYCG